MKKILGIILSLFLFSNVYAADSQLKDLTELGTQPADNDLIYITDTSNADASRKIQYQILIPDATSVIKGKAAFDASEFVVSSGTVSLSTNLNAVKIGDGSVSSTEFQYLDGVTSAIQTQMDGKASTSHTHAASALPDAAADGATKGVATFTATDFNASSGVISLDLTNAQAATASQKGLLTSTDWSTFSNKAGTASPTFTGTTTMGTLISSGITYPSSLPSATAFLKVNTDGTTSLTDTSSYLSTSGLDTSAELRAILGDETGNGYLVFSGSPSLTGTTTVTNLIFTGQLTNSGTAESGAISIGNTGAHTITIKPSESMSSDQEWYMPEDAGTNNYVLTTNGAGVLSWEANGAATPAGTTGDVQFNSSGSLDGTTKLSFNKTTGKLTVGDTSAVGKISIHTTGGKYISFKGGVAPTGTDDKIYTLPQNDGSAGQVLSTDGSANLSWTTAGSGSGSGIVNSAGTGQVGYYASAGTSISGTPNLNWDNSTGTLNVGDGTGQGKIRLHGTGAYWLTLKGNTGMSGSVEYTLPAADGSAGQVLYTNGSTSLGWTTTGSGGGSGTVSSGTTGQIPYYASAGTTLTGTSTVIISNGNIGIGTDNPIGAVSFATTTGNKIDLWQNGNTRYGLGVQQNLMQLYTESNTTDIAFGYGSSTSFTELMRIKGNGNVGIGTDTPKELVHLGAGGDSAAYAAANVIVQNAGATSLAVRDATNNVEVDFYASSGGGQVGTATNHDFSIMGNDRERIKIKAAGNVGISVTSPLAMLHIGGDGTVNVDGTKFIVANNGNVGIGTTVPITKLHVNEGVIGINTTSGLSASGDVLIAATSTGDAYLKVVGIGGSGQIPGIKLQRGAWNTDSFADWSISNASGSLYLTREASGVSTNQLVMGSSGSYFNGNVGIGTNTPTSLLQVQGKGTFAGATNLSSTNVNIGVGSGETDTGLYANNTNEMQVVTGGIVRLHVSSDGSIKIMGTIPVGAVLCVGTNNQLSWAGGTISAGGTAGVMKKITSQ